MLSPPLEGLRGWYTALEEEEGVGRVPDRSLPCRSSQDSILNSVNCFFFFFPQLDCREMSTKTLVLKLTGADNILVLRSSPVSSP